MSDLTPPPFHGGRLGDCPADEPYDGVVRRAFDSRGATVTRYEFAPGARFPQHRHPQEQIVVVEEGDVEFTVAGSAHFMRPGDWAVVSPEAEHGLRAGDAGASFLAILVPRRENADAYSVVEG